MPNEAFLGKETENKKNKEEEEEKRKVYDNNSGKNSGSSAKRGEKMRGGIDRPASKVINKDDVNVWDKHNFDVWGEEVAEWEMTKGKRTATKREGIKQD